MRLYHYLELASRMISSAVGVLTLYIGILKVWKASRSKRKRNASNDVPK